MLRLFSISKRIQFNLRPIIGEFATSYSKRFRTSATSRFKSFRLWGRLVSTSLIGLQAASLAQKKKGSSKIENIETIIKLADQLYDEHETEKLYQLLIEYKDTGDAEVLWRLARAARDLAEVTTDNNVKQKLVMEAYQCASNALQANGNCYAAHKWYAILLDASAQFDGVKARIEASPAMLKHFMKALELNPNDATTYYLIGLWHFSFADLAWYHRKLCTLVYNKPPESSYGTALEYFEKAEKVEPGFYSKNTLMLGKTYARMNQKDKAIYFLKKVLQFPMETPSDIEAQEEAAELLRSLGVNV